MPGGRDVLRTMHMRLSLFCVLLLDLCGCTNQARMDEPTGAMEPASVAKADTAPFGPELEEHVVDSTTIGRKGLNKVIVDLFRNGDSSYVELFFGRRYNDEWAQVQQFHFLKDGIYGLEIEFPDLNNDGFSDITIKCGVPARSANEIRRAYVYDPRGDSLIYLVNSSHYPNMLYNDELDLIDAFLVYGGSSTVFLKIRGDSLMEVARVDLFDGLTVVEIDEAGTERVLLKDTTREAGYVRYKTYRPLKPYKNY